MLFDSIVWCEQRKLPIDKKFFTWADQEQQKNNFKQIEELRKNGKMRQLYPDGLSIKKAMQQAGNDS